jgi:hypothetical protein
VSAGGFANKAHGTHALDISQTVDLIQVVTVFVIAAFHCVLREVWHDYAQDSGGDEVVLENDVGLKTMVSSEFGEIGGAEVPYRQIHPGCCLMSLPPVADANNAIWGRSCFGHAPTRRSPCSCMLMLVLAWDHTIIEWLAYTSAVSPRCRVSHSAGMWGELDKVQMLLDW